MFQPMSAVPVVVAVLLASVPAQARLGTRSLLEPRPGGQLGAAALTERGHTRGWLLAQAELYDIIKTRDGKVHFGKILRETAKGYLFATTDGKTAVIEFEQITSISNTGEAAPVPAQPAAAPAQPAAAPVQPAAAPAQPAAPPLVPAVSGADTAHVYELQRERAELEANSPSIGGPIVMMCIGVPLVWVGYLVESFGFSASGETAIALIALGWTGIIVGTVLAIVGSIRLIVNIVRRGTRSGRMNEIDEELERLRRVEAPREPPNFGGAPSPRWLVAAF